MWDQTGWMFLLNISLNFDCVFHYSIVQGADWRFGPHNFGPQPEYVRKAALATMIICFIGFIAYLVFLVRIARHDMYSTVCCWKPFASSVATQSGQLHCI